MPNFDTFAGHDMVLRDKVNILGVLFSRAGINFHLPVERLLIQSRQRIMLTKYVNVCVCVLLILFLRRGSVYGLTSAYIGPVVLSRH